MENSSANLIPAKAKKPNKFLLKTYNMINESKNHSYIDWTESGNSLIIRDVDGFTCKILPKYFKHKNFASFIRQLNMYEFSKSKETEQFVYSHPLFVKGNKQILGKIKRKFGEKSAKPQSDDLIQKLLNIGDKQKNLMQKIESLKRNYEEVANHNQELLVQIHESKQREKSIHEILIKFSDQFTEIPEFLRDFYHNQNKEIVIPVPVPLSHYLLTHQ